MPTFQRPVKGDPHITCTFQCHRDRNSVNPGVDYGVATGTDIFAPEDGVVTNADWSGTVGYWIGIDFDNGWGADLMHNSQLLVSRGQRVKRGQKIAESGGTGSAATGPHLHWSLRQCHGSHTMNAKNVDPEKYVGSAETGGDDGMLYVRDGDANWHLYDGIKWTELSDTPHKWVSTALGREAGKLSHDDFVSLKAKFPNKSLEVTAGGLTKEEHDRLYATSTSVEVEAIPEATAALINGETPPPLPPQSFKLVGDIEFDPTSGTGTVDATITPNEG